MMQVSGQVRNRFGVGMLALCWLAFVPDAMAQDAQSRETEPETAVQGDAGAESLAGPLPDEAAGLPQVEPIIEDEDFSNAIPELPADDDPELGRELEPIADFERRLASDEDTAAESETELERPLQPLGQFEVTPVELTGEPVEPEDAEIAYRVEIEGLEAADKETSVSLRGQFRDLSALRENGRKAANLAMVRARLTEDEQLVRTLLESEGWYSARVRGRIDQPEKEGEPLVARITVRPGKRYRLADIRFETPAGAPTELMRESLPLKIGEPIIAERVQAAEANVAVVLPQNGYPFAQVGNRDILLDRETGGGDYTLHVEPGPLSRFDGFATDGDLAFDADHIEVMARFERGELYDSRKVDDLRKALVATGLFATVSVEPKRTGQSAGEDSEYVSVFVQQDAGPARTISGSAGFATGEGYRIEANWMHRNLFRPEGALIVHGIAGTSEQGAGVTFRRSNAGRRDRTFELAGEVLRSDFSAYNAYTGRLGAFWRYESTPIWQKRFTWAFGGEVIATAERDFDFARGERNRRTFYIAALSGQAGFDQTDSLLDPTSGFRLTALVQPEGSLENGFNPYVRARIDGSAYMPLGDSFVLAGRVRVGTIQGADRPDIAPSRRFYSGGGGSVRGFAYQKLGPLDPDGDPIGGRSLNEAAVEGRYRFGDFGIAAFVDAGQSYAGTMPKFSDLRFGAGIGGRYYTNFGPIRIDLATPIDRRPGESRLNLYVSIGQAF